MTDRMIQTCARAVDARRCRSTCLPPHLPEVGFEPTGGSEDLRHVVKSRRRQQTGGEIVELTARRRRHLAVGLAGIFGDPGGIGVLGIERARPGGKPGGNLEIADDAGGERDMKIEEVAGQADVHHVTRIGKRGAMFRHPLDLVRIEPPVAAIRQMQVEFALEDGGDAFCRGTHVGQPPAFDDRQRVGAGKLDQEQVVLGQIRLEGHDRQRAVAQAIDEAVVDVGTPVGGARRTQTVKHIGHRRLWVGAGRIRRAS